MAHARIELGIQLEDFPPCQKLFKSYKRLIIVRLICVQARMFQAWTLIYNTCKSRLYEDLTVMIFRGICENRVVESQKLCQN